MLHEKTERKEGQDLRVRLPLPLLSTLQKSYPEGDRQLYELYSIRELDHIADFLEFSHSGNLRLL